jgi:peptidyl-prolyl cis-trans isomerase A (cyclophilin A)
VIRLALVTLCACIATGVAAAAPPQLLHPETLKAKAPATYRVSFKTTKGTFVVTVHRAWSPRGADRFYNLTRARFFDGVTVKVSNTPGTITYADAGPDTRTTQVFVNYGSNSSLDAQGFSPFGRVTSGMKVLTSLYGGYGDQPTGMQQQITTEGDAFLHKQFPKLDHIVTARITR